jgi:glycosyltransferase involved in cell wall biosynthesis
MISVIMSVYNESITYLHESISSIQNQTFNDIELIIVDDNPLSSDIKRYLIDIKNKGIAKVVFNNTNLGQAKARNIGIKIATGDYIAIMDADDIAVPYRFERQLSYMKKYGLDFVYSNFSTIDEYGNIIKPLMWNLDDIHNQDELKTIILDSFNPSLQSSWLMKIDVIRDLNGYRNLIVEDLDFNLRVFNTNYKQGYQNKILIQKRTRKSSVMGSHQLELYLVSKYITDYFKTHKTTPTLDEINSYYLKFYNKQTISSFNNLIASLQKLKKKHSLYNIFNTSVCIIKSKYSVSFLYNYIRKIRVMNRFKI